MCVCLFPQLTKKHYFTVIINEVLIVQVEEGLRGCTGNYYSVWELGCVSKQDPPEFVDTGGGTSRSQTRLPFMCIL